MSDSRKKFLRSYRKNKLIIKLSQICLALSFLLVWEVLAKYEIINSFITSSPSKIIVTIINLFIKDNLIYHIFITLSEISAVSSKVLVSSGMVRVISICGESISGKNENPLPISTIVIPINNANAITSTINLCLRIPGRILAYQSLILLISLFCFSEILPKVLDATIGTNVIATIRLANSE